MKGTEGKKRSQHLGWGIDSDHREKIRLQSPSERDGEGVRFPGDSLEQLLYFFCPSSTANAKV